MARFRPHFDDLPTDIVNTGNRWERSSLLLAPVLPATCRRRPARSASHSYIWCRQARRLFVLHRLHSSPCWKKEAAHLRSALYVRMHAPDRCYLTDDTVPGGCCWWSGPKRRYCHSGSCHDERHGLQSLLGPTTMGFDSRDLPKSHEGDGHGNMPHGPLAL